MNKIMLKVITLCTVMVLVIPTTVFAKEQNDDLKVDIGNTTVDVEKLAEKNGVDAYELKEAILEGLNSEKASPFSNLKVEKNTRTEIQKDDAISSQSIETSSVSRATNTKESKKSQDSTAYVAKSGALTASGKTPAVGMCAMNTNVTTKTGNTTSSTIKLGTKLYMNSSINVNGASCDTFVVEDRGAPQNRTSYWIDIYFGINNTSNYNAAVNYGVKSVSYYYYY